MTFEIDGEKERIETVWVHFQGSDCPAAMPFTLTVPSIHARSVFDPHGNCPPFVPLDAYLMDLISELGTFVVGGYVKHVRQLMQREQEPYQWVIADVNAVDDTGAAIVVRGKVVPFIPEIPVFKELR